ncbi:unnamed protein product [Effrenium voratum]|nr:unnamed protein product [Effrenium voratum]
MTSWSPVEFQCPDVRIRGCKTTSRDEHNTFWAHLKPGVGYEGVCNNKLCLSYTQAQRCGTNPGHVVCSMGFGKHRPNEDYCYKQIVCPACKGAFFPHRFFFQKCSAKINFCIKGETADEVSLSEDRGSKSRVFGKRGSPAVYIMLVIEVDLPGKYPDVDELEVIDTLRFDMPDKMRTSLSRMSTASSSTASQSGSMRLNPMEIRYIQDSISNRFQCGRRVRDTMEKLRDGRLQVEDIPKIRAFQHNGRWYTEDNRRLWAFKEADVSSAPVQVVAKASVDQRKFTSLDDGASIRMRGW